MRLATEHGFDIACHAIGDEANTIVLDCAERTHAHGSIEHAQMLKERDIPRLAQLGLAASIQPQHAMDDRDVITRFWGNPAGIPYAFNSLHRAGIKLLMGSDAPVAPLDPWLPFPQRCSARRVPTGSLSSLSNVWISKPRSLRPPPWGVRRCKLEMRQT